MFVNDRARDKKNSQFNLNKYFSSEFTLLTDGARQKQQKFSLHFFLFYFVCVPSLRFASAQ